MINISRIYTIGMLLALCILSVLLSSKFRKQVTLEIKADNQTPQVVRIPAGDSTATISCPISNADFDIWFNSVHQGSSSPPRRKVIVSIGHNGFGNQLFQHYFAQKIAQCTQSRLYITRQTDHPPVNTLTAHQWMTNITPPALLWESLPSDHPDRVLCTTRNFSYFRRPIDDRQRSPSDWDKFSDDLRSFLDSTGEVKCLVSLGYYQWKNQDISTVRHMWGRLTDKVQEVASTLHSDDIYLHLRCENGIYGIPSEYAVLYYGME